MSRTYHYVGIKNAKSDFRPRQSYRKFGRAVIYLAQAEQEKEAKAVYRKAIVKPRPVREKIKI